MNKDTLQSADKHQHILLLLPWYLNQSLDVAERQLVANHLHGCMSCRRELVALDKLAATVKQGADLDVAADASFNAFRVKLQSTRQQSASFDAPQPNAGLEKRAGRSLHVSTHATHRHKPFWDFFLTQGRWLAIAASLLLVVIPFAMHYTMEPSTDRDYRTLSDSKADSRSGIELHVVFSKSISDASIDALLAQIHGQRIEGPNSVGAYTVQLNSGKDVPELVAAISFLRNHQDVILAEPVLQP